MIQHESKVFTVLQYIVHLHAVRVFVTQVGARQKIVKLDHNQAAILEPTI